MSGGCRCSPPLPSKLGLVWLVSPSSMASAGKGRGEGGKGKTGWKGGREREEGRT